MDHTGKQLAICFPETQAADDAAKQVGGSSPITTPTIYLYFADKKGLYVAACRAAIPSLV